MSDDVVLKVSLPGFDVKTATPEQCAIHSNYDTLKLKLDGGNPYFQRISIDFKTSPGISTVNVFAFTHNLPNTPAYYFFASVKDSSGPLSAEVGNEFDLDVFADRKFQVSRAGNTIKLDFITSFVDGLDPTPMIGKYYEFRFYCYANDGL